jgi:osmotically-inducible protein OsmY
VHESSAHSDSNDADLISGMLTAIKNFVAESFKDESGDQNLYEIQYGDSRIILERGRYTYLSIVAKGNEPVNFDDELTDLNNDIHKKYHKDLRSFNGEFKNLLDIKIPIKNFLKKYNQPVEVDNIESKSDEAKPILLYLIAFLLLSVLVIYSIIKVPEMITENKINNEIQSRLDSTDKLSTENISWEIDDNAIKIFGFVNSFETRSEIDRLLKNIPNVETFENNLNVLLAPVSADSIIYAIKNTLKKTKFNQAEDLSFEVNNDKVVISGKVETLSDKRELGFLLSNIHGVKYLENNLEYYKLQSMSDEETKNYLKNTQLIFNYRETKISEEHIKKMNQIIPFITQNNISLIVNAFVETEGNEEHNREYALMRAENVISYLESQNVSRNKLTLKTLEARNLNNSNQSRRIEFEINQ